MLFEILLIKYWLKANRKEIRRWLRQTFNGLSIAVKE